MEDWLRTLHLSDYLSDYSVVLELLGLMAVLVQTISEAIFSSNNT